MTTSVLSLLAITTLGLKINILSELSRSTYLCLLLSELEGLASLEWKHSLAFALGALDLEDDLLGGLGLLSEDGLSLTTETLLLGIVTSLTLSDKRSLTSLVLSDLVARVLLASLAIGVSRLWNADHRSTRTEKNFQTYP
jgi:hypothetical protein